MMKSKGLGYIVLGIFLVLVSLIAFVVPTEKTGTFWIAYVFTAIAIVAQVVIWENTLGKKDTLKSKFLGLPIVHVGIVYLIVQTVALVVFTAVPALPIWSVVVACAVILGLSVIFMVAGEAGRREIERVEAKVQKKVFFMKELQADVEFLIARETDAEIRTALQQLAEKIRFSNPMSDDALSKIESTMADRVAKLKIESDKLAIIHELDLLLAERNKKCKS